MSQRLGLAGTVAVVAGCAVLALLPADAGAQTYRWVDGKGVVHYSQGMDSVPERYRDPRLSPADRATALEALRALRDLESLVTPEMGTTEYQWRLRRLEEVVPKALRAMKRGPVVTRLSSALGNYRLAGQLIEHGVAVPRGGPTASDRPCQRLPRPAASREPIASVEDATAALLSVWRCASDQRAAAETLMDSPGSGPWAEQIKTPPKPRR